MMHLHFPIIEVGVCTKLLLIIVLIYAIRKALRKLGWELPQVMSIR